VKNGYRVDEDQLGIRQKELARLAKIHHTTLSRLESAGRAVAPGFASTIDKVVAALEAHGVEFIELGVRLTKRPR
jgi:transcriptional regulator with XRE-family HTH domain